MSRCAIIGSWEDLDTYVPSWGLPSGYLAPGACHVPPACDDDSNDADSSDDASISSGGLMVDDFDSPDDNPTTPGLMVDDFDSPDDNPPMPGLMVDDFDGDFDEFAWQVRQDVKYAARCLDDHGLVVFKSQLSHSDLDEWLEAMHNVNQAGLSEREPFDNTHFSYNGCPDLPLEKYMELILDPNFRRVVNALLTPGWTVRPSMGGDVVRAGSTSHQLLHSDWPDYKTNSMRWGYALVCSIALEDIPEDFAAIRFNPWSTPKATWYENRDSNWELRGSSVSLKKGDILLRDCRCPHSGMPNKHDRDRVLPGSPWNPSP